MLGKCKGCAERDKLYIQAKVDLSDLKTLYLEREKALLQERKELLDRVMLLTKPSSVRELRMEPTERKAVSVLPHQGNLPGDDRPFPRPTVVNVPHFLHKRLHKLDED